MLKTDSKASSQFIIKALKGENILLKSEGNQHFSYVYATEAVKALFVILLRGNNCEAYNISSEKTDVHLRDFAELCAEAASRQVVFDLPSETERKGYSVAETAILDNSKLIALGFQPKYELREAIMRTIEILKDTK